MVKIFSRLQSSLKKTREGTFKKLNRIFTAKRKIDDDLLDEIEEILISGDVGVETTLEIIDSIKERVKSEKYETSDELEYLIKDEIKKILLVSESSEKLGLKVILVVGMNKVVDGLDTAMARVKHYAGPVNAARLGLKTPCVESGLCSDCRAPQRICNMWSVIEGHMVENRIHVKLVGENLGY